MSTAHSQLPPYQPSPRKTLLAKYELADHRVPAKEKEGLVTGLLRRIFRPDFDLHPDAKWHPAVAITLGGARLAEERGSVAKPASDKPMIVVVAPAMKTESVR